MGVEGSWIAEEPVRRMVKLREYRIPMPMTVEEYKLAQLYMTAKTTRMESQNQQGAGVEILRNTPSPLVGPAQ